MRHFSIIVSALLLSACLEAQIAPDLPERPSTDFTVMTIGAGLKNPWAVAPLPDGSYLVTEKAGQLFHYKDGSRQTLTDLPRDLFAQGQGGLLDIVLAPDFEISREIYLSYSYGTPDLNGTALMRAVLPNETLEPSPLVNPTVIFQTSPPKSGPQHFGGKIAFLPDDTVVLALGDGFSEREDAQKPDTHLGKLVRLTRDGGVPEDNPYLGQEIDGIAFKPQIYSMGHRNVQGLAYDAQTGVLWEHEHGPRGGDELNIITAGANYGWPLATKGRDYQGARISPYESFDGTMASLHDWTPSIAPSGLAIYRGDMFPEWDGDALVGGLASRDLRRVDLEKGVSVGEEDLLSDLDGRVRDVRIAPDGAILILIDDEDNGQLLRLTPK